MTDAAPAPILVGVDGSEPSLAACDWAAREARLRNRPVYVVHGYIGPTLTMPLAAPPYDWLPEQLRREAEQIVASGVAAVRAVAPEVTVTGEALAGAPGALLSELSRTAHLLVVGHRGHGGFGALLLGSVPSTVVAYARAPVVVVRRSTAQPTAGTGPVVVGVDGSAPSRAALRFGFEEAALRGLPLHAVYAYTPPPPPWRAGVHYDPAEIETAERHQLADWVRPLRAEHPGVPVEHRLVTGNPAERLLAAARDAVLLVIGSRGRGGFTGLLLGSVSLQVVRHAVCPVAVLH